MTTASNDTLTLVDRIAPVNEMIVLPYAGDQVLMAVTADVIDDLRGWGGIDKWINGLESMHGEIGDFAYPWKLHSALVYCQPRIGKMKNGRWAIHSDAYIDWQITDDVVGLYNATEDQAYGTPFDVGMEYFVDNFERASINDMERMPEEPHTRESTPRHTGVTPSMIIDHKTYLMRPPWTKSEQPFLTLAQTQIDRVSKLVARRV